VIELVIVGAGGHGRQLLDLVDAHNRVAQPTYRFLGFLDDGPVDLDLLARRGTRLLGPSARLAELDPDIACAVAVADPAVRRRLDATARATGREASSFRHPTAVVGSLFEHGPGLFLSAGVIIDTNVAVGRQFHINLGASVGHESRIGDHVTITPGVRIGGNCTLGDDGFFGANASVVPGVTIGDRVVVGANVVVRHDLPSDVVFTGHDRPLRSTLAPHRPAP